MALAAESAFERSEFVIVSSALARPGLNGGRLVAEERRQVARTGQGRKSTRAPRHLSQEGSSPSLAATQPRRLAARGLDSLAARAKPVPRWRRRAPFPTRPSGFKRSRTFWRTTARSTDVLRLRAPRHEGFARRRRGSVVHADAPGERVADARLALYALRTPPRTRDSYCRRAEAAAAAGDVVTDAVLVNRAALANAAASARPSRRGASTSGPEGVAVDRRYDDFLFATAYLSRGPKDKPTVIRDWSTEALASPTATTARGLRGHQYQAPTRRCPSHSQALRGEGSVREDQGRLYPSRIDRPPRRRWLRAAHSPLLLANSITHPDRERSVIDPPAVGAKPEKAAALGKRYPPTRWRFRRPWRRHSRARPLRQIDGVDESKAGPGRRRWHQESKRRAGRRRRCERPVLQSPRLQRRTPRLLHLLPRARRRLGVSRADDRRVGGPGGHFGRPAEIRLRGRFADVPTRLL